IELTGQRRDGHRFPMDLSVAHWSADGVLYYSGIARDITERKRAEDRIHHQANYDALTDLPNRNLFMDRLGQALLHVTRVGGRIALMFIDLDRFKWVNDHLGHAAGDELLVEVSVRLTGCVRRSDTIARLGGDEFTVLLPGVRDDLDVSGVAQKILERLAEPFYLTAGVASIFGSIGIAFFPDDAGTLDQILHAADVSMYEAKRTGGQRYCFYNELQSNAGTQL
ncbi:MAG: GGDEF domain-containing protein, partial [Magnetococcales bacterium]|nr:GGDEF domain-containing protein [Magnetococcales bacterium]